MRTLLGSLQVAALALAVLLPGAVHAPPATSAVLVSAAGNVVSSAHDLPTAVYYHGAYSTKAKCVAKRDELLATGRFHGGGCLLEQSGPYKGKWRLWMDEKGGCTDRVDPTGLIARQSN